MMVAYPLFAYIAILIKQPLIIITYLLVLLLILSIDKLRNQQWLAGILLVITIAVIAYVIQQSYTQYLLYFPPMLIILSLFLLFSQSLMAGQTPLISRYAQLLGDALDAKHLRYNRALTIAWSAFFLLMLLTSILLAVFSSQGTWSFFTHVISYPLIALFFIIEFMIRKHHFAGEIEGGFFHFMAKIIKIRPTDLHDK